ncbi:DUF3942 family protein [Bacillus thuringiensis]|uniref:DUF3942 family protein n=1 Tax=Bacillus thuringiensis TaxID=1428 RepID=UPI000E47B403|nr:DUF3942 family protein [Bacillus thuringiensis]MDZ3951864.1 DUF3942 family protein [Bacillus thuringiensis]RGP44646.1 hypothetical protein BTW32_27035 [Bacillus thuringiensis]
MDKLDQFIEKAKSYIVTDLEEKLLLERYKQVILPSMQKIKDGLKQVKGYDYDMTVGENLSTLRIHDKEFVIIVDSIKNHIEVYTRIDNNINKIDKIILREENLFSSEREEIFTKDILVEYLNEAFQGIIG